MSQGPTGKTGHVSANGKTMSQRIEMFGEWEVTCGENISYGHKNATDVITQLLVDDGVQSRGHRTNFFKPEFKVMGCYTGDHK
jgi:uncharacterized protein YkwD